MASTSNHRHGHIIPPQLLCDILAWSCRTQKKVKRCDPCLLLFLMMFNTSVCCLLLQITCRMLVNSPCYICMIYIKGAATCTIAPVCRAGHSRSRRPCFLLLCDTDLGKFVALQKRWMSVPLPPTKVHLCVRWRKKNDFGVLNCISNPGQVIILFWAVGLYWDRTSEWGSESQTAKKERERNKWIKRGHMLESNLSHQQGHSLCRRDPGRTRWAIRLPRIFSHNAQFNIRQVHLILYLATFLLGSSCHCYDNISFVADPAFSRSPSTIHSNHCLHLSFI